MVFQGWPDDPGPMYLALDVGSGPGFGACGFGACGAGFGAAFMARRFASAFSTAVNTPRYEESWHTREASLQERLEVYKTPLTREEEGLRFQIKHVSNRDVSEREIEPRSS